MTIQCANCHASVSVRDDQWGKPCECPGCQAILLIPRLKGDQASTAIVEAKSFEDLKKEILEAIRPEVAAAGAARGAGVFPEEVIRQIVERVRSSGTNGGPALDELVQRVSDSLKPDLARWVSAQSAAASVGIDAAALREQLRSEILREVRADLAAMPPSGGLHPSAADAFARAIEALGSRLTATPAGAAPMASSAPAAEARPAETRVRRKPFKASAEAALLQASPKEQYPPVTVVEPDAARVIALNAGNNENLKAFLEEIASGKARRVMFEPTQSVKDVGTWRKGRVWISVTAENILLAAYGRRPFKQEIPLQSVPESFWNEFTSEVVFVPLQPGPEEIRSIKLTYDRAHYLLGLILHGVPA